MSGSDAGRANRAEIRNPILSLPSARRLAALPPEAREALCELLEEMRVDSAARAQHAWDKHKAPMAAYWKAASVYCGHIRRAIRRMAREDA